MNKYEQLIEHIINDEQDKARELFHKIAVEKCRDIYESLIDEEDLNEIGGNPVEDLVDEVTVDEQGIAEEEEEEGEELEVGDNDYDADGELDDHEEDHGEIEDRVMDLESAIDELKAEFDALMAGEAQEPEHADMMGGDEEAPEQFYEAAEEDDEEELDEGKCAMEDEEEDEEELDETIVREYVEKVGDQGQKSEGGEVGAGKSASINAKSTVAGKNDMGGSTANIVKGGAESNPDGQRPHANASKKGDLIGKVQNTAGGTKSLSPATKPKAGEGQTTGQAVGGTNTKSPLAK